MLDIRELLEFFILKIISSEQNVIKPRHLGFWVTCPWAGRSQNLPAQIQSATLATGPRPEASGFYPGPVESSRELARWASEFLGSIDTHTHSTVISALILSSIYKLP